MFVNQINNSMFAMNAEVQLQHKQGYILISVPLFYQLVSVKNLKDKFKNSVVTIQEQKK
jgi:hypothetical protein